MNAADHTKVAGALKAVLVRRHSPQPVVALTDRFQHFATETAHQQHLAHIEKFKHLTPF